MFQRTIALFVAGVLMCIAPSALAVTDASVAPATDVEATLDVAAVDGIVGSTQDISATPVEGLTVTPTEGLDSWVEDVAIEPVAEAITETASTETVAPVPDPIVLREFSIPEANLQQLTDEWIDNILATYPEGTWAPLKTELTDRQLDLLGLPSSDVLLGQRFPEPTMIDEAGNKERVDLPPVFAETGTLGPTVATFAGAGWFGIRPGALVLLISGNSIGWCSRAHVYGSPGSYQISTAGHCGKGGDVATVVAGFGQRGDALHPILLDFGTFKTSTDGGLGNDKALISIASQWQSLATPTAVFWGGPRGVYTKTGSTVAVNFPRNNLIPSVSVNPDPLLAQAIVHYGHGTGVGTGGTPRAGTAIHWGSSHYMFEGVITFGDSGSYSNVIVGDTVGGSMEAAGINTHIYVDPLMRQGIGIMGGTRATAVSATLANGQIVPYPAPLPGLP